MVIFQKTKLGDLVNVKGGKRLPLGHELTNKKTNHPYIRARDIGAGKITFDDPVYVDENTFPLIKSYIVNKDDVCITIVGANVGDIGFVPLSLDGANLTENAVKLFPKDNRLERKFLKYCLLTNEIKLQMKQLAGGGAAQPKLGLYKINKLEIPHPTIENQARIASILSAYDDLIENNEKRIKILEEMANRLYTEWFVKFKFPGHEKMRMVDSGTEFGKIPEGWEVTRLGEIADIKWGDTSTTKQSYISKGYDAYSASGMDGKLDHFDYEEDGIVLSAIGANCGLTWLAKGKWSCIKNTIRILKKDPEIDIEYLFLVPQPH